MAFNENTRVKIPAILHLCRLGYKYLSLSKSQWDFETNIFVDIFTENIQRINPHLEPNDVKRLLEDIILVLDNEDLGEAFYKMLVSNSGIKLIDFTDFDNNSFHVITELTYKNGDDEFRPDITLLINGMPLAFIEVKKPNNHEGILQERDRINVRFKNKKFRKFINISQVLVFSNNMEYDRESIEPIQGAFYTSTSYSSANFNCFREGEKFDLANILKTEDDDLENLVLKDNNLSAIKHSPEFITNKEPNTPTNRILTSLFSKDRFAMILKYGIAYVNEEKGLEKHIMRYPQIFATKAIERKLDAGIKKGIIWHTQGSGKTALSYYNVKYLTDYFQRKNIVPKFYFIVDRIDLLEQAKKEFNSRGLIVHTVNSKEELLRNFKTQQAIHNLVGKREITVVNIQKFKDDDDVFKANDYDINTQRIYFLDEVHRSYNPTGSFLANLLNSDRNAIIIGLTGTPLIGNDRTSRQTFGDYIHKYYYNDSIADGYTLKLIREDIETTYKFQLKEALKEVEILKGDADKRVIYAHAKFAEPMLDYIIQDFIKSRIRFGDHSIGAMVVCDSADQARKLFEIFINKYNPNQRTVEEVQPLMMAAEAPAEYDSYTNSERKPLVASLILHDIGSKEDRKNEVEDFKNGKIDILFVYNMLLTGFDAKRLKKLYIGRIIKNHNLLQTLTRVNRPYKKFKYGYVVDFADITKEFNETNRAYFDELQAELGDEMQNYSNLFKSREEIEEEIKNIKEKLFHYDLRNAEIFSQQISEIADRQQVLEIKKALEVAKNLYNLIRLEGHFDLLEKIDFKKLNQLYNEAARHLDLLNLKNNIENNVDTSNLLNVALENVIFMFRKISEEEMLIADQLKDMLRKTREALSGNFDPVDPQFVNLYEELKRLFNKKNLDEISQDDMRQNIGSLQKIYDKVTELNRKNNLLKAKYENDAKYARLHKRIIEKGTISKRESEICETLTEIKNQVDEKVLINTKMLNNESYFDQLLIQMVISSFGKNKIELDSESAKYINTCLVKEYMNEYQGNRAW
ncbi:type I restriction endonuclease subunit R [Flavobacterium aurantiibacter]|uniref:type I site-specific deoxyribonuclease n=1 Tax=Flavobacterium aurantiibacter TaxID=2023067 RepID=A0A255ZS88_9FLAO|nr:type I restriction endonuclease [Flavobacterium aurantiibacter]OYQ44291.1 restriction endonuclease subunit R [Flavobacterium aurantiibacter]